MNEDDLVEANLAGFEMGPQAAGRPARSIEDYLGDGRQRLRGSLLAAGGVNPDEYARATALARQTGLPADLVARNFQEVEQRSKLNESAALLDSHPRTAGWLSSPDNAKLAHDDVAGQAKMERDLAAYYRHNSFLDRLGQRLTGGWMQLRQGVAGREVLDDSGYLAAFDALDNGTPLSAVVADFTGERRGSAPTDDLGMTIAPPPGATAGSGARAIEERLGRYLDADTAGRTAMRDEMAASARDAGVRTSGLGARLGEIPRNPAADPARTAANRGDWRAAWDLFGLDPLGVAGQFVVESAPNALPGLALAPLLGPMVGLGLGSATSEMGASIVDSLRSEGIDPATAEGLEKLKDPAIQQRIRQRALTRGLVIGALDGLSGGLAGSGLVPGGRMVKTLAYGGMQAGLGMAGEGLAEVATGEPLQWGDILAEGLGELAQSPIEAGPALAEVGRQSLAARRAQGTATLLDGLAASATDSRLRQRSPDSFAEFVGQLTADTPAETVFVPAEAFVQYMQSANIDPFALVEELPGMSRESLADALATGGDLAIPTGTFAGRLAPDHYAGLRDDLRLSPFDKTAREAREFNAEVGTILRTEAERAQRQAEIERAYDEPAEQIRAQWVTKLRVAGRTKYEADTVAAVIASTYRTMGERLGENPLDLAQRFGLDVSRHLPPNLAAIKSTEYDALIARARSGKEPSARAMHGDTLLEFIAKRGGVIDDGGELAAMDVGEWRKRGFGKLLRVAESAGGAALPGMVQAGSNPHSLEEVARAAADAGYLPDLKRALEDPDAPAPDMIAPLLESMRRELSGQAIYSEHNIDHREESVSQALAELRRLLDEAGIVLDQASDAEVRAVLHQAEAGPGPALDQPMRPEVDLDRPVPIVQVERQTGWSVRTAAKDLFKAIRNEVVGGVTNTATGWTLTLTKDSFKHGLESWHKSVDRGAHVDAGRAIREMVVNAIPVESHGDRHDAATTKQIHRMFAAVRVGGDLYAAKITVKEHDAGHKEVGFDDIRRVYDYQLPKKMPAPLSETGSGAGISSQSPSGSAPSGIANSTVTKDTIILRDLLSGLKDEDGTLYFEQRTPSGPRGRITFPAGGAGAGTSVITLTPNADLSTILHELGHWKLQFLTEVAASPETPAEVAADVKELYRWFWGSSRHILSLVETAAKTDDTAAAMLAEVQARGGLDYLRTMAQRQSLAAADPVERFVVTQFHEYFARGFEAYLFEGKAPSPELADAFSRIKAWMLQVYRQLKNLSVRLSPEVRQVMDRMLATDAEIREAARRNRFLPQFASAAAAGLTEAEYQAYLRLGEREVREAEEQVLAKSLRDVSRRQTAAWKQAYAAERGEVEMEVQSEPIFQALHFLRSGQLLGRPTPEGMAPLKLSHDGMVERLGRDGLRLLPRGLVARDGVPVEIIAEMFGFGSGDSLVQALRDHEKRQRALRDDGDPRSVMNYVIDTEAESRTRDRHGDRPEDGGAAEDAVKAFHTSDAREKLLAAEMKILQRLQAKHALKDSALRQVDRERRAALQWVTTVAGNPAAAGDAARRILERMTVEQLLRPGAFLKAEITAADAVAAAIGRGDHLEAAKQKWRQLLNHQLYRQASEAKDKIEASTNRFARLNKADKAFGKTLDADTLYGARAILARFGLTSGDFDFHGWLAKARDRDPIGTAGLEQAIGFAARDAKPWKKLTWIEWRGLTDAVGNILQTGRNARELEIAGEKLDKDQAVAELAAQAAAWDQGNGGLGQDHPVTEAERRNIGLLGMRAALTRIEGWARVMDEGRGDGPFTRYLVRPIHDALGVYRDHKKEVLTRLLDLLEPHRAELLKPRTIVATELGDYAFGNKGQLIHAISHTGNDSNMRKLLLGQREKPWGRELPGGRVDTGRWDAFIRRMAAEGVLTKADFDLVQSLWDLNESLKLPAQQAHRKMYGYYFDEVTARPLNTPFGVYQGGYMPALTDRLAAADGGVRGDQDALAEVQSAAMFPSTGRGFTKSRVEEYKDVLQLDLALIPGHLDKVLRFTYLEGAVKQAARVVQDRGFRAGLSGVDRTAIDDMLMPWLQRTARQSVETPAIGAAGRAFAKLARVLRSSTGLQIMALNLLNAAQNITGYLPASVLVKPAALARAQAAYARAPGAVAADIQARSAFMRHRMDNSVMELAGTIDDILRPGGALTDAQRWAERHGYVFQQVVQNVVDVATWRGMYDQQVAAGAREADAVFEADSAVRRTQGSFAPEDVSRFETGNAVLRLFTMFYSYFNVQGNLLASETAIALHNLGFRKGRARLGYIWLVGFFANAVLADAIARSLRGDWDDEDDGLGDDLLELFLGAPAKFAGAMVPVVGTVATGFAGWWNDKAYDDRLSVSPVISAVETVQRAPVSLYKAIAQDGSAGRAVKDTLSLLGLAIGLPTGQLARTAGYMTDVESGRANPEGLGDAVQGLVSGRDGTVRR